MTEESAVPTVDDLVSSPDAYDRLLPEIKAVQPDETIHLNLDVMVVVTMTMGCIAKIVALKALIARMLPEFNLTLIDKLDEYAAALQHAFVLYVRATRPVEPMPEMIEQLTVYRELFHADALALAKRGLIQAEAFEDVKKANGHRPLVVDVQLLASILKDNLSKIGSKSAVTLEELHKAIALADQVVRAIGLKEQTPAQVAEATLTLKQAFTLFARVHEEVRWAVRYVRRQEGDADAIMPSIYATRQPTPRRRGAADGPEGQAAPAPTTPPAPAASAAQPPTPNPIAPGLPGASPFVRT